MKPRTRVLNGCGIKVGESSQTETLSAVEEIAETIGGLGHQHLLVLFSKTHNARTLCKALSKHFPDTPFTGCSTAGEIGPGGSMDGGIVIVAFPGSGFEVCAEAIENIRDYGFERAHDTVRHLRARLSHGRKCQSVKSAHAPADAAEPPPRYPGQPMPSKDHMFGILLVDGLSNAEEILIAAINWAMGDITLVGGSSGDRLGFENTVLIHNGEILTDAAILLLVDTIYPFAAFNSHNFDVTPNKLVVTAADPENRIVYELNAENAAVEYARTIGLMPDRLDAFSFASHPLVVKVGDEYYCRSIRRIGENGSLEFFCAIDEGIVLTVADPGDLVNETLKTFDGLEQKLGSLDVVIAFECILRRLDAETRQVRHRLEDVYRKFNVVGFQSYGEQLNAMHLNQTLTGIAFGSQPRS